MGDTSTQFHVDLEGVRESAIAIGDHNAIHTAAGTRVIRLIGSEAAPEPRLRRLPIPRSAGVATPFFGRAREVGLAGAARPGSPFQVHGPEGVGKSALLKHLVAELRPGDEGVVHAKVRRRGVYDIQAQLFKAFWECEVRFTPAPEEMPDFLGERRALVVLDDVGLDRSDLEELLEAAPECTFVLGSEEQTLWSGAAERLSGLEPEAALQLIELRLERPLAGDERAAAAAVAAAVEGHPQRLVEASAGVRNGTTSFQELARGRGLTRTAHAPQPSEAGRRVLAVLRTADAELGTERIAELSGVPDAAAELAALERDGWITSSSPRYRLTGVAGTFAGQLPHVDLLTRLTEWAGRRATPEQVADESEAIESALERVAPGPQVVQAKLALARAAEAKLALAGMLDSWERVLVAGLDSARAAESPHDEAYMLHQLGSRAIVVGRTEGAVGYLQRALELREQLGDAEGAEVTRANLQDLLGGGGRTNGGGTGNGGGGPWLRMGPVLALFMALIVAFGIYAVADDDGEGEPVTTERPDPPPAGKPPAINIDMPAANGRYDEGDTVTVAYACSAAPDAALKQCRGPVKTRSEMVMREGVYKFTVVALDTEGRAAKDSVTYTVEGPGPPPKRDTTKPTIDLRIPVEGATYYLGELPDVDYSCSDDTDGDRVSCEGTLEQGAKIDGKPGNYRFTVTAIDRAGNDRIVTRSYTIEERPSEPATPRESPSTETEPPATTKTVPEAGLR